jgi:transposase
MVPDELWALIEPLLPVVPRRADHQGRRRLDDRTVLCGILFVLYTGIPWDFLPQELGFGSADRDVIPADSPTPTCVSLCPVISA